MTAAERIRRPSAAETKTAINEALDLLHRRWMLRVIWELRQGPLTFRALAQACGEVSPSVLNQRLKELRDGGLVAHARTEGYALTPIGRDALEAFEPFTRWARRWWLGRVGAGRGRRGAG